MSEPTYSNDPSDLEENKPLTSTSDLRAFDGIASSPTPRGGLLNTPSLRSCCLLSSQPCRRLGSSYIYNDHIYRTKKTCIVGPHFPATLFIVLFISGATWFFGFVTPRVLTLDILGKETPSFVFHQCVCLGFWVLCNYLLMKTGEKLIARAFSLLLFTLRTCKSLTSSLPHNSDQPAPTPE